MAVDEAAAGYRTYEIYQRERVGESTALIKPRQLLSEEYLSDPYPLLAILREHYPCYRDWVQNGHWITRYDDVTSVFVDDANFETRSKAWHAGQGAVGRDLGDSVPVLTAWTGGIDREAPELAATMVAELAARGDADLAVDVAAVFPLRLLGRVLALPDVDVTTFATNYLTLQRGATWDPAARQHARDARAALVRYFEPILRERREAPGDDLVSAVATLEFDDGPATADDLVTTLGEADAETLHGGLANLWFLLLTHPEQLAAVRDDRRLVRFAWQEMLRHSTPVPTARRYARHEVERFGRLLPEGGLVLCSAAAANRDPRVFTDPDRFLVTRKDICQREPRGQYRADGLPAGVAVGLGRPSRHPAVPEDRPRSWWAITRDVAVTVTNAVLDAWPDLVLAPEVTPRLRALRLGEMHTCWHLPVRG